MWLCWKKIRERCNESEHPEAQRRLSVTHTKGAASLTIFNTYQFGRADSAHRCGSGVQATGREWREESAQVRVRQERRSCDWSLRQGATWRMVELGQRIARGVREHGRQAVSDRSERSETESQRERRSGELACSRWQPPASAGVGALRGVPARMGSARRRLARGESPFPVLPSDSCALDGLCALRATCSFQPQL